ncbi:MAG: hypothetical protein AAGK97_02530 [Bacteroidota bacterium]
MIQTSNYFKLLIACFVFLISTSLVAQPPGDRETKIAEEKATFLQNKLKLTPDEAGKFWDIYNEYNKASKALKLEGTKALNLSNIDLPEAELEKRLEIILSTEEKSVALKRAFFNDLKSVISVEKIAKLVLAEKAFNREMLKRLRERRKGN